MIIARLAIIATPRFGQFSCVYADLILEQLSDGAFHSGQHLAQRLGVTRTAVWKHVSALADLGVPLERVRGRGYRIPGGIELLDADAIRAGLGPRSRDLLAELQVHRQVDSTNAVLARAGVRAGGADVCLAEYQSAGRGRRGRHWVSPFGSNVYLSIAWQFSGGADVLQGLPLAVGVALCEALEALGVAGLALKWPNDVLRGGAKLAGILVEMSGDAAGPCGVVVGVGVNIAMPARMTAEIGQSWADLSDLDVHRNPLVVTLLNQLLPLLGDYERGGFAPWRERWAARDAYLDQPVRIEGGGRVMAGIAAGVDAGGALLLRTDSGVAAVHGGEVSLRSAP